jgi:BirA family transcriptional regulator, biotin operon repressor / biotin---[acetyl-CoA-carboxylase] ligase
MIDLARLRLAFPERQILYFDSLDSTQRIAAASEPGSIVLADRQLAGLGRHGHTWHSAPGTGIYCSLVLPPSPVLTLALGIATVEAIAQATGIQCDLRWPNDLMLGNRKAAGILVQLVNGQAVAGIGINVNQTGFPDDLQGEAISLRQHAGREFAREDILFALFPAIDSLAAEDPETVLRLFTHASSYAAGRRVTVRQPGGVLTGTTAGLDSAGFLIVRRDDGTDTLILAGGVRAAGS